MIDDKERCCEQVHIPQSFGRFHQCKRRAVIDDKCKQHAPSVIEAKKQARYKQWEHEGTLRRAERAVESAAAKIVEAVHDCQYPLPGPVEYALRDYCQALARLAELKGSGT